MRTKDIEVGSTYMADAAGHGSNATLVRVLRTGVKRPRSSVSDGVIVEVLRAERDHRYGGPSYVTPVLWDGADRVQETRNRHWAPVTPSANLSAASCVQARNVVKAMTEEEWDALFNAKDARLAATGALDEALRDLRNRIVDALGVDENVREAVRLGGNFRNANRRGSMSLRIALDSGLLEAPKWMSQNDADLRSTKIPVDLVVLAGQLSIDSTSVVEAEVALAAAVASVEKASVDA